MDDFDARWDRSERLALAAKAVAAEEHGLFENVLCARCTRGHVFRRAGKLDVQVYCHAIDKAVPSDIAECSDFARQNEMTLSEMERLALRIDAREGGGQYI